MGKSEKAKSLILDEGNLQFPHPTKEMVEHVKKVNELANTHRLNEKNEIRHSGVITQSLNTK